MTHAVVMLLCGGLKHALLDGSREYMPVENSRGPFQCAVVLRKARCQVHSSFSFSWTTSQVPSKHWSCFGNWLSSPSQRREPTAAEPHFLKRRRLQADLVFAFRIFTGLLNVNWKSPPLTSRHRRRGWVFSVKLIKHWNKRSSPVYTASMLGWIKFGQRYFPISSVKHH